MNPMWKVYKSKVLKTLNPEHEEDTAAEEVHDQENDVSPIQEDEGPNAVSQIAKKMQMQMQGAGAKGWNKMSSLFNKDDEHQLLEETESPPVPDHPLAVRPEEPPRPNRGGGGFWGSFANNWAAKKQAEAAAAAAAAANGAGGVTMETMEEGGVSQAGGGGEEVQQDVQNAEGGVENEGGGGGGIPNFSKYMTLGGGGGGGNTEASFKWNFVTSKIADLKTKGMAKSE